MRISHLAALTLALTALAAFAADPPKPKRTVKQIDTDLEPAMKAVEKYDGYSLLVAANTRPDSAAVDTLRKAADLLTKKYNIDGIPTVFLIDKAGICRSVNARNYRAADIQIFLDEEVKK